MKIILITRPEEEAENLGRVLTEKGFCTHIEPLLRIEQVEENKPALETALARKPQAILITSRRGLKAFAEMTRTRDIPVFTVGTATAHYAETLGFSVSDHCETSSMLIELVAKECDPHRALLYIRGEDIRTDIAGLLGERGFHVDSIILYRAVAAQEFSTELRSLIAGARIAGALFFSRRTAAAYATLAHTHGLASVHRAMSAVCMSEAIAEKLRSLPWASIRIAQKPDREHMLQEVESIS